jgi:hypothetical protein
MSGFLLLAFKIVTGRLTVHTQTACQTIGCVTERIQFSRNKQHTADTVLYEKRIMYLYCPKSSKLQ